MMEMAMVGMVQMQMKRSETARLRMNLFPTVRREGFFVAQSIASMFPGVGSVKKYFLAIKK